MFCAKVSLNKNVSWGTKPTAPRWRSLSMRRRRGRFETMTMLGRAATLEDVGNVAAFVASLEASGAFADLDYGQEWITRVDTPCCQVRE